MPEKEILRRESKATMRA